MTFRLPAALLALAVCAMPAPAYSLPLFRYALERWPPAQYRLVAFHKGGPTPAEQKQLDALARANPAAKLLGEQLPDLAADAPLPRPGGEP